MALLLQVLLTGLAAGAVYGLVAISFSLIHRLTGVVHFALGELISLVVFVTLAVAGGTGPVTRADVDGAAFAGGLAAGLAAAVAVGTAIYVAAVRPFLARGWALGWIGGTVAAAFAIRGVLRAVFPRASYVFPDPVGLDRLADGGVLGLGGGVTVPVRAPVILLAAVLLAAAAAWVLERSALGRALRATSDDPLGAAVVGLPVAALLAGAFAAAGALAGLAAILQGPAAPISTDTGALLGLKGLVAALIARFGRPWAAFAAGLALGLVEASVGSIDLLGAAYRDVVPLALVVAALLAVRRGRIVESA